MQQSRTQRDDSMLYTYSSLSAIHKSLDKNRKPAAPVCREMAKSIWDSHFSKGLQESRKQHHSSEKRAELEVKLVFLEKTIENEKRPVADFMSSRTLWGFVGIASGILMNESLSEIAAYAYAYLAKGPLPVLDSILQNPAHRTIASFCVYHTGWAVSFLAAAYSRPGFKISSEFSHLKLFVEDAKKFSNACWKDAFSVKTSE